jgi:N-ethylmaleimide reductase
VSTLFEPCQLGDLKLKNRIVMAPMTRSRASEDGTATAEMVDYYRQRASAGLIVAEGTYPSEDGKGYCRTPGIVNAEHIASWKAVTSAVHEEGGTIVLQIMHCGRCSHEDNKSSDAETVAPSAISADGEVFTEEGMKPFSAPRALKLEEIPEVVEQYRQATINAFEAGFDGVELHCASGYLPAQFLSPGSNQRDDEYGGALENRVRFVREVLEAMASVQGAARVGLRFCPGFEFNDVKDPEPWETFQGLLESIQQLPLAYVHLMRASTVDIIKLAREYFPGPRMLNGGYTAESALKAVERGDADVVSFASSYIANPDLVERFRDNNPLSEADPLTAYTPGAKGYSDYPAYGE